MNPFVNTSVNTFGNTFEYVQARSDAANPQNGDAFRQPFCRRQPHTDPDWRQDWEKYSDGLKDLFESVGFSVHANVVWTCIGNVLAQMLGFKLSMKPQYISMWAQSQLKQLSACTPESRKALAHVLPPTC